MFESNILVCHVIMPTCWHNNVTILHKMSLFKFIGVIKMYLYYYIRLLRLLKKKKNE